MPKKTLDTAIIIILLSLVTSEVGGGGGENNGRQFSLPRGFWLFSHFFG